MGNFGASMYCGNGKMKKSIEVVGYLINWMISADFCGALQKATRKLRVVRLGLM